MPPVSESLTANRTGILVALLAGSIVLVAGCAEGRFWRLGRFSPRIVEKWEKEEQIANSVFERKLKMSQLASSARANGGEAMNNAARELGEVALTEPILINRIEAIHQLAQLNCPIAWDALRKAITDPNPEVRLAVVTAWKNMSPEQAVPALNSILSMDSNIDVRLAAVRMIGEFPGQSSLESLGAAINDADPAIQLRATESLTRITGQKLGPDVRAWANYLKQSGKPTRQAATEGDESAFR